MLEPKSILLWLRGHLADIATIFANSPTREDKSPKGKVADNEVNSPTTMVNSPNELDRLPQLRIEMTSLSATKPVGE